MNKSIIYVYMNQRFSRKMNHERVMTMAKLKCKHVIWNSNFNIQTKNIVPELYMEQCQPLIEILENMAKEIDMNSKKVIWY